MGLEAQRLGATVHALPAPRRAGQPMPMFGLKVVRQIGAYVRLCRRERFDIVDAWLYLGYGLAALTRPVARVPVLIAGRRSLGGFKDRFGPVDRTIDAIARRSADVVVANAQAVADDAIRRERLAPSRVRVIRNGVAIPPPTTADRRAAVHAAMGITDDAPVVGCIGTFKPGKGQDLVLQAFASARAGTGRPAWLVFVGDGPTRPAVASAVRAAGLDRVVFQGTVPDARSLYDGMDIVASGSDAEGLPNVVLEAAAAGRPVVATAAGGTAEVIQDGATGRLVPVGDEPGLGRALADLLAEPEAGRRLGVAARADVAIRFGIDRFVAETAALYEEMDRRHGR
jgi:glycosyltransferase involved in cell wall biosynthesis